MSTNLTEQTSNNLFEGGNLVFLSAALFSRLLGFCVSLYLFIHHVPSLKRWTPAELKKPFLLLSKQQQYRCLTCLFLFMMLLSHTFHLLLEMVVVQNRRVSLPMSNGSNVFGMIYHFSVYTASFFIILAELDRYKRITLVIPGSSRDKILHRISWSIFLLTAILILYYWACIIITLHDDNNPASPFLSPSQLRTVQDIRNIITIILLVYETVVELYYNASMVSIVLKEYSSTNSTAPVPQKRKMMKLLVAVFAAHLITLLFLSLGNTVDFYYPFSFLALSILPCTIYVSFALTDVLLQCVQEAKHNVQAGAFPGTELDSTTQYSRTKSTLDSKHESFAKHNWARNIIASFY